MCCIFTIYSMTFHMKLYFDKRLKDPTYYAQLGIRNTKKTTTKHVEKQKIALLSIWMKRWSQSRIISSRDPAAVSSLLTALPYPDSSLMQGFRILILNLLSGTIWIPTTHKSDSWIYTQWNKDHGRKEVQWLFCCLCKPDNHIQKIL